MRDQRVVRATYYLESEIEPARAAAILADARPDLTVAGVLIGAGAVLGVLGALLIPFIHLSVYLF